MKRTFFFIILLLVGGKVSRAQIQERIIDVPGEIVYADRTEHVTFQVLAVLNGFSVEHLEKSARYVDANGHHKIVRPKDAEEIRFKWDEQDVRMISRRPRHESSRKKFMHLLTDGSVRFYEYIETYRFIGRRAMMYASINTVIYWYLERKDATMIMATPFRFRKKMSKYFKDCPKLAERIKAGAYKALDAQQIVDYYNGPNCQ